MWAYNQDTLVKIYPISLGKSPVEHKIKALSDSLSAFL